MTGKPFLYDFGLMNTVVIEDDMDPPSRVKTCDMVEKLYELLFSFAIENLINPLACTDVQGPEDAPSVVSAWCRDADLLSFFHPHSP